MKTCCYNKNNSAVARKFIHYITYIIIGMVFIVMATFCFYVYVYMYIVYLHFIDSVFLLESVYTSSC